MQKVGIAGEMKYKEVQMKYSFEIPKRLPSFNEYMNINRYNKYAGNNMKQRQQSIIQLAIYEYLGTRKINKPVIRTLYMDRRK